MGEPSWQPVKAGQEIKLLRREAVNDIGKSMMLTFQTSLQPNGMRRNSEVLLGGFEIPEVEAGKAEEGGAEQPSIVPDSKLEGSEKPKPKSEGSLRSGAKASNFGTN